MGLFRLTQNLHRFSLAAKHPAWQSDDGNAVTPVEQIYPGYSIALCSGIGAPAANAMLDDRQARRVDVLRRSWSTLRDMWNAARSAVPVADTVQRKLRP